MDDPGAPRRARRALDAPALRAALIQFAALGVTSLAAFAARQLFSFDFTYLHAALLQGTAAALLSRGRLAGWWVAIQFLFAPALLLTLALRLPPALFLGAFLFFLLLYWSTFRTQVPFYPSGPALWREVAGLLPAGPVRVADIGSGLGGLLCDLADRRPDCSFSGIELAPLPWLVSRLRAGRRANLHFVRGDYESLHLADFDLVFAYLSPAAMDALWRKAVAEMRPGALLLSFEFPIPGVPPALDLAIGDGGTRLYGWYL